MTRYRVEIIKGEAVEKASTVVATTPVQAAIKIAGGQVTFRRKQSKWIKVTPVGASTAYGFVKA
jgi:hypothetical protein